MKTEIENVTDVKKVIHFEIPWEDVDKHIKQAIRLISKNARIPGFRPGKAPESLIRNKYAQHIKDEVIQHVVPEAYKDAISQNELEVISEPEIHDVLYTEGSPFVFKVTVETKPKIELKDYKGLPLKTLPVEIKDEEVDSMLKSYQQRAAELIPLEDTAADKGHFVSAKVQATLDTDKKQKLFDDRTLIEIGSEENHPAFNEHVSGKKAGEHVEFDAVYAADYPEKSIAGKTIHYSLDVENVNEKRLPAIDDEFAKDLGDFTSLSDLREKIKKDLTQVKTSQQRGQLQDQALGKLIEENPFEVPESLVNEETASAMKHYAYSLHQRRMNLDDPELKWDEIRARFTRQADNTVRGSLIMEAIARAENIEVTEEDIEKRIQLIAEQERRAPEAVKAEMMKEQERMDRLKHRILLSKTADFIIDNAQIEYIGKESEKHNENS
ncbi:trigger factor [bacterium]|nr:trigger factor [bacterium]MCI0605044.1 trigger factor [bacterium]